MKLQNLDKMEEFKVNIILEKVLINSLVNHGYGNIKIIIADKKICDIIPTEHYSYKENQANDKKSVVVSARDIRKYMHQIQEHIKYIKENNESGLIKISITNHLISSIDRTQFPKKYLDKFDEI